MCVTPDLESIVCQWNGSGYDVGNKYNVSYQMDLRYFTVSHLFDKAIVNDLCLYVFYFPLNSDSHFVLNKLLPFGLCPL